MTSVKTKYYYRGESDTYDFPCIPTISRLKNVDLLNFENKYYTSLLNKFNDFAIFQKAKHSNNNNNKNREAEIKLKSLGILQHYGQKTRLLDITSDRNIALYFAAAGNYKNNGFIYKFNTYDTKELLNKKRQSIIRKLDYIQNIDKLKNISVIDYYKNLEGKSIKKSIFENNVIIDYKIIFNTTADNLRYEVQKGKFILFGNKLDEKGHLTNEFPIVKNVRDKEINKTDKIDILIELCIMNVNKKIKKEYNINNDKPICYVTIYPDDEFSIKLQEEFIKLTLLNNGDKDNFIENTVKNYQFEKSVQNNIIEILKKIYII
jgi:hypothetical protein